MQNNDSDNANTQDGDVDDTDSDDEEVLMPPLPLLPRRGCQGYVLSDSEFDSEDNDDLPSPVGYKSPAQKNKPSNTQQRDLD